MSAITPAAERAVDSGELEPLLPVHPSAFPRRGTWKPFWHLSRTLAVHEIKRRYFGSALGHVWSVLKPLMLFGVMYFVFTHIVRFGGDVPHYPIYLLTSIVIWTFFAEVTALGVGCLLAHEHLMRKINFPRFVIPFSLAMTTGYQFLLNAVVVLIFALASGVNPRLSWLGMIPLLAFFWVFSVGVALSLASLYVRFRDVQPIWEVGSQVLFWASPIIYVASFPPESVRGLLASSPISATMTQMRFWFIDPSAPTAAQVLGGRIYLLIPIAITIGCAVLGILLFRNVAARIAELS
jgi:ABC-2 type transport system permease protein